MRTIFFSILLLFSVMLCSQEVYQSSSGEALTLNAMKKDGDKVLMKVLTKEGIRYFEDIKEQVNQLSFKRYIDTLLVSELKLFCSGDEPFWNLTITKDKITYNIGEKDIEIKLKFYYPSTDDYWLRSVTMFQSSDNHLFGTIERITNIYDIQEEEVTFLHCRVCIDGVVYVGTIHIEETEK